MAIAPRRFLIACLAATLITITSAAAQDAQPPAPASEEIPVNPWSSTVEFIGNAFKGTGLAPPSDQPPSNKAGQTKPVPTTTTRPDDVPTVSPLPKGGKATAAPRRQKNVPTQTFVDPNEKEIPAPAGSAVPAVPIVPAATPPLGQHQSPAVNAPNPAAGQTAAPVEQPAPPETPSSQDVEGWRAEIVTDGAAREIVDQHAPKLDAWIAQLEESANKLTDVGARDEALRALPSELEAARVELRKFIALLTPKRDEAKAKLERLGPTPKDGEPREADLVAEQRRTLEQEHAAYDGLIKRADLLLVKAGQQIEKSNTIRRERFATRLLQPAPTFHSLSLWSRAFESVLDQPGRRLTAIGDFLFPKSGDAYNWHSYVPLVLPAIVLVLLFGALKVLCARRAEAPNASIQPSLALRSYHATCRTLAAMVPWLAALATFFVSAAHVGILNDDNVRFVGIVVIVLAGASLFSLLLYNSTIAPPRPWRVIGQNAPGARIFAFIGFGLIATWVCDQVFRESDLLLFTPYPVTVLRGVVLSALYAALLLALLFVPLRPSEAGESNRFRGWPVWLFIPICCFVAAIAIAAMTGYVSLALFIGGQVVATGGILYAMFLVHMASEHISSVGAVSQNGETAGAGLLRGTIGVLLDIAILLVGVPAILLQWGFDWPEVQGWLLTAFFGFQVGSVTISLQAVLVALAILIGGIFLTRLLQRWFMHRIALTGRVNNGLRDSVRTGLGYAGFALAVLTSASFLGIDLSNLAIVAGALSVGIGFGLQSIFNNFVSGLILLVERPIKIGDWVTVGGFEGHVRKINVRATEIETFDKQSIIVPNSEFISGAVTNWMYGNRVGRVVVDVGVSYNSDPEQVRDILLSVAKADRRVLSRPEPAVVFIGYGDSSLNFDLCVFIADIDKRLGTSSDLRFAIFKALKENNIEIPFPQRDLHIRSMDGVKQAVGRSDGNGASSAPAQTGHDELVAKQE